MAVSRIPLLDTPRQSMFLRLGGVDVRLVVWWQPRDRAWYASLEIPAGTPAVSGRRIVVDGDVLAGRIAEVSGYLRCRALTVPVEEPGPNAWAGSHALQLET